MYLRACQDKGRLTDVMSRIWRPCLPPWLWYLSPMPVSFSCGWKSTLDGWYFGGSFLRRHPPNHRFPLQNDQDHHFLVAGGTGILADAARWCQLALSIGFAGARAHVTPHDHIPTRWGSPSHCLRFAMCEPQQFYVPWLVPSSWGRQHPVSPLLGFNWNGLAGQSLPAPWLPDNRKIKAPPESWPVNCEWFMANDG